MFLLRDEIGLTPQELIELAGMVLWRDVKSTEEFDDLDVRLMLAALQGYGYISHLVRTG